MSKRFSPDTPNTDIATRPHNTSARVRTEVSSERTPYGRVTATVRDKNGNIVGKADQNVDSLVRNFWLGMYTIHSGANNIAVTAYNGTGPSSYTPRAATTDGALEGFSGIIVGSSNVAVAYADVQMGSLITHGVGTGQLSAEEMSQYYDPVTDEIELVRTFVNADTLAATITVREVGFTHGETGPFLVCRDVLDAPLDVPYEGVLTVVYRMRFFNGNANMQRLFNRSTYRQRTGIEAGTSYVNVVATNGTGLNFSLFAAPFFSAVGAVGASTNGIVLGSANTNPTTKSTWDLDAKIEHGEGSGQLFYYESTISSLEEDTTNNACRWYLNRVVQNRSGGTITVSELGLFSNVRTSTGAYVPFMVDRTFPDEGGVAITNSAFATFSWEICYQL